jgi:hypothetical protein
LISLCARSKSKSIKLLLFIDARMKPVVRLALVHAWRIEPSGMGNGWRVKFGNIGFDIRKLRSVEHIDIP